MSETCQLPDLIRIRTDFLDFFDAAANPFELLGFQHAAVTVTEDFPSEWTCAPISDGMRPGLKPGPKAKPKTQTKKKHSSTPDSPDDMGKGKPEKKNSTPSLLANLVRCGNQMSSASSWAIVEAAFAEQIQQKLRFWPLAALSTDQKLHEHQNIQTLELLGLWEPKTAMKEKDKETAVMASAKELISFLVLC